MFEDEEAFEVKTYPLGFLKSHFAIARVSSLNRLISRVLDLSRYLRSASIGPVPLSALDLSRYLRLSGSQTVVACLGIAVGGFISWNAAYITWMYVEPTLQRHGIGWRLLQHALRQIGLEAWTDVIAVNEPALALYRWAGFEVVCRPFRVNHERAYLTQSGVVRGAGPTKSHPRHYYCPRCL